MAASIIDMNVSCRITTNTALLRVPGHPGPAVQGLQEANDWLPLLLLTQHHVMAHRAYYASRHAAAVCPPGGSQAAAGPVAIHDPDAFMLPACSPAANFFEE